MEQLNNLWYRFPISIVEKELNESLDGKVPPEQMEESWVDVRFDSIVGIRPFYDYDYENPDNHFKLTGTVLYTTAGTDYAVNLKPSTVRKILNYEPIKIKADEL